MPLETATFLTDLVTANPAHTDGLSQADSHMRLLKSTIKATFPNFTSAALNSTQAQLDAAVSITAAGTATPIKVGTAALPGLYVLGNPNTGIYQPATNQLAMSLNGTLAVTYTATGINFVPPIVAATVSSTGAFSGGTGQLVPIGGTLLWWDDVLPTEGGYAWCNGQIIASANTVCPVLLARWGSRFGGNGTTTMGVPDLRDTVPVGKSTMGGVASRALQTLTNTVLGTLIGLANNVLVAANLPPITSSGNNSISVTSTSTAYANGSTAGCAPGSTVVASNGGYINLSSTNASQSISVTSTGTTSTAVNNVQPSTTCNYILRLA